MLIIKTSDPKLYPTRANPTDAGLDLCAAETSYIQAHRRKLVGTGVSVKIPPGFVGFLVPRSSLSKQGLILTNSVGVIDSDYRGEIMASLMYIPNHVDHEVVTWQKIEQYQRIVQLVILPIALPIIQEWEGTDEEWIDTNRGVGGFGSTGR